MNFERFKNYDITETPGIVKLWESTSRTGGLLGGIIEIEEGFKAKAPLPTCPFCGEIARPNILMFGDYGWEYARTDGQRERLVRWMDKLEVEGSKLAIVEIGAGTAVPTVRNTSEQIAKRFDIPLIRINPRESFDAEIELPLEAIEALSEIIS